MTEESIISESGQDMYMRYLYCLQAVYKPSAGNLNLLDPLDSYPTVLLDPFKGSTQHRFLLSP